jgi:hypothetical protein
MLETRKYDKDQFNPMFGQAIQNNGSTTKKGFEPFRNKQDIQKYQYVVDWQIEEENIQLNRFERPGQ